MITALETVPIFPLYARRTLAFLHREWRLIMQFKKTGIFPDIKIVSINNDAQSSYGKQEVMVKGFIPDEVLVSSLDESTAALEASMPGSASDCDTLDEFNDAPTELLN